MKDKFLVKAAILLSVLCVIFGSFYYGKCRGAKVTHDWYKTHMDTITTTHIDTNKTDKPVADTEYVDKPVPYPVYIKGDTEYVNVIEYKDSIVYVMLPRTVKEYRKENYYAKISGVDPSLDYIETYNKTIENTVYVPQKIEPKRNFFAIEGAVMYDAIPLSPVTANLGYRRGLFEVSAGAGYDFFQKGPVVKAQLSFGFSF